MSFRSEGSIQLGKKINSMADIVEYGFRPWKKTDGLHWMRR